jgi:diguanylate cyclase (GGDEF)-like protein/PAS domain S-box-containing protein
MLKGIHPNRLVDLDWQKGLILAGILWTVILAGAFLWSIWQTEQTVLELARQAARSSIEKDILYRRWAALHGGVYVPMDERTPPNPYLEGVPEQEIVTPSGRTLTLVNPAFMTRQVHELQMQTEGQLGHITSLNPIRPENAADEWERRALMAFDQGEVEISSTEALPGGSYLRLMRPLVTEASCLNCHAAQGYQVGDIRGGISVSIPLAPYQDAANKSSAAAALRYCLVWGVGLVGLGASSQSIRKRQNERNRAQESVRKLSQAVEQNPASIVITDMDGIIEYVNPKFCEVTGYSFEEVLGKNPRVLKSGETPDKEYRHLWETITSGEVWHGEFHNKKKNGDMFWERASISPIRDAQNMITHFIAVKEDISARKRMEEELRYLGTHDSLTGLYNHAFFYAQMEGLDRQRDFPVSVLIADVDGLKVTNDSLGHAAGDQLLLSVAEILRSCVRGCDVPARLGGDEFGVILPGANGADASLILERIQDQLSQENGLYLSIGYATALDRHELEGLVRQADDAMYSEKKRRKAGTA